MTTPNPSASGDLFFEPIVDSYLANPRFLRRDWLADQVNQRLDKAGCRFVLLTAPPGAGKSTFMAQLAGDQPRWPRYFIRRDQRTPLGDVGAHSFLLRIGYQLAARFPEAFSQANLELAVQQRIGVAAAGSEVVGAEVGRIIASPFYRSVITIQQEVEQTAGRVVGLRVEELVVESQLLDLSQLVNMAIVDPANALLRMQPDARIVILVDALDEIRYHDTQDNILRWLINCPELPANVRFVLSSRPPDSTLQLFCQKQAPYLQTLTLDAQDQHVQEDVRAYVGKLVAKAEVAQAVSSRGQQSLADFAEQLAGKAHGNLGYLDALGRAVDDAAARQDTAQLAALLDLSDLPDDLEHLYAFYLHQIKAAVARERVELTDPETGETYDKPLWPAVYGKVLGVLAVALTPLTLAQVSDLGAIAVARPDLADAVDRLRPFLDRVEDRYRLYHATVAEFLTAEQTRDQAGSADLYVDPIQWHGRVAGWYWARCFDQQAGHHNWSRCDDYGLASLPLHLDAAGKAEELGALLASFGWQQEKLNRSGTRALLVDYELALAGSTLTASDRAALSALQRALRLSAHILAVDKRQLAAQVTGRLMDMTHPRFEALCEEARQQTATPWLRPLTPGLLQADSPIVFILSTHTHPVRTVAITSDGRRALSGADDGTVKIWNVQTCEELHTLHGHSGAVLAIAVDPTGRQAVSAAQDGTLRIWDLDAARQARVIDAHAQPIAAVAITPDGQHVISGSYDGAIKVWDLATGAQCRTLHGHAGGVNAMALTPDGAQLISGSYDRSLKLWDLASGEMLHTFHGHGDQVASVAISADGRWLVSGSFDRTLRLWDLASRSELHTFSGHGDAVTSVAIAPDGRMLSGSWDTTVRVWDLAGRASLGVLEGHSFQVHGLAITPDGQRAISASGDTTLNLWDLTAPLASPARPPRAGFLKAVAVTPDGRYAVCWREQNVPVFEVWDLQTTRVVHEATGYLDYRRGDLHLRAVGYGQGLQVRNLASGVESALALRDWTPRKTIFLPGGQPLEFYDLWTPVVRLVAPDSGETVRAFEGHTSRVFDVALTPDGTRLLTTSDDRTVGIWELASGRSLGFLRGHTREVWSAAVAGDSRTAVTSSDDRSVIVWDLEQLQPVARFSADGALTACAISPDGNTVITGDEAGRMHLLRLEG